MNWGSDERYTLEEARRELARRECAQMGHRYDVIQAGSGQPKTLLCSRCGKSWEVESEAPS